ncbi:MAG: HEPN domain-containing protein [Candidatus Caldatribacterium sp.]|nr:HEPN domain-containing protein [Candidatus Caldatribacterium sp.]
MQRNPAEEGRRWFLQAEHDLDDARYLFEGRRFHLACFLAQQAAEKALKAFLYSLGADFVWGHSLAELSKDAQEIDPDFASIAQDASSLDKYYIPTRYPNGLPGGIPAQAYTEADAHLALSTAQKVIDFVRERLKLRE